MTTPFRKLCWAALAIGCLSGRVLWAQGPSMSVEPINTIVTGGQPIDRWYPNEFDPFHPKDLILDVWVTEIDPPGATGTLFWYFDWLDLTGGIVTTPLSSITLPGGATAPVFDTFRIPFCPQQVSLHMHSDGTFRVDGAFTHICLPEPSSISLAAFGAGILFLGWRRRRRMSNASAA